MRQIYQKATTVIVWLGDEDDTTALALATMWKIFERCCSYRYGHASREQWLMNVENDEEYWQSLQVDIIKKVLLEWPDDPKTCTKGVILFWRKIPQASTGFWLMKPAFRPLKREILLRPGHFNKQGLSPHHFLFIIKLHNLT
jgi:hypothetical protein